MECRRLSRLKCDYSHVLKNNNNNMDINNRLDEMRCIPSPKIEMPEVLNCRFLHPENCARILERRSYDVCDVVIKYCFDLLNLRVSARKLHITT